MGIKDNDKTRSCILNWDDYGQPVSLVFQGQTVFRTMPGACVSIFAKVLILVSTAYLILDYQMNNHWSIQTLEVGGSIAPIDFSKEANFSLAVKLVPKMVNMMF
jgi:hypothetical protein